MSPVVGVLGAGGAVGREVVARLPGTLPAGTTVRASARRPAPGQERVDVLDPAALASFVDGCDAVVNCAGPSSLLSVRALRATHAAGAAFVDVGTTRPAGPADAGTVAVFGAGLLPGLSGLLPLWLARRHLDRVDMLTAYARIRDEFTPAGATDYVRGLYDGSNRPGFAWRNGAPARRSSRLPDVLGPYDTGVSAFVHLDDEGVLVAGRLGVRTGDWLVEFDGDHLRRVVGRLRGMPEDVAAAELRRCSRLDLTGRSPEAVLSVRLGGVRHGRPVTREAVLRGGASAPLVAAGAVLATRAVLSGLVPAGWHHAAAVADPDDLVTAVTAAGGTLRDVDPTETETGTL